MPTNPWPRSALLGAILGLPLLGGGGRVAMRAFAWLTDVAPAFSFEGTLTVLLLGLASGIAGGLLYALLDWLSPHRRWVRALLFATGLLLLKLRGLNPVTVQKLLLFAPVVLLYGAAVELMWHRGRAQQPQFSG